jgi:hypothetical protein
MSQTSRHKRLWLAVFMAALTVLALLLRRGNSFSRDTQSKENAARPKSDVADTNQSVPVLSSDLKAGRALAEQVCGSCHIFPEPEIADRFTWANGILPRMSVWLGYDTVTWTNEPGGGEVIASGKVPNEPLVDLPALKLIHDYYLSTAPLQPLPQINKPELKIGLKHFRVRKSPHRTGHPMTTFVKIDERAKLLLVGDAGTKKVSMLKPDGTLAGSFDMPNPIVHLLARADGFYATMIGSLFPSDLAEGQLVRIQMSAGNGGNNFAAKGTLLSQLRRPVECAVADLNGDGREDVIVASYGNVLGHFSWYEQNSDGSFQEHVLLERPGAVGVKVHDFDGDGRPDIVVVMAQAHEAISLFVNRGAGQFEEKIITQKHPGWGFTHLEIVDFNNDGQQDLLVTNGDNGDNVLFPNCVKPYHGIRLYLNEGRGQFREAWFYPIYGAYHALARDFDLDGDLDIAAISFFPDYFGEVKESFTYLENEGGLKFAASTFVQSTSGRWITMDAGDLDGDGDIDIVLCASNRSFGDVPKPLAENWEQRGTSVLLLENTVR